MKKNYLAPEFNEESMDLEDPILVSGGVERSYENAGFTYNREI